MAEDTEVVLWDSCLVDSKTSAFTKKPAMAVYIKVLIVTLADVNSFTTQYLKTKLNLQIFFYA